MDATHLHIKIEHNGVERFRLALPTHAASRIAWLLPPELAQEARLKGVDLDSVETAVRGGNLTPRSLLKYLSTEGKHVSIWLE
jgi:hypothetical protein